jgi:hypothetical protein
VACQGGLSYLELAILSLSGAIFIWLYSDGSVCSVITPMTSTIA